MPSMPASSQCAPQDLGRFAGDLAPLVEIGEGGLDRVTRPPRQSALEAVGRVGGVHVEARECEQRRTRRDDAGGPAVGMSHPCDPCVPEQFFIYHGRGGSGLLVPTQRLVYHGRAGFGGQPSGGLAGPSSSLFGTPCRASARLAGRGSLAASPPPPPLPLRDPRRGLTLGAAARGATIIGRSPTSTSSTTRAATPTDSRSSSRIPASAVRRSPASSVTTAISVSRAGPGAVVASGPRGGHPRIAGVPRAVSPSAVRPARRRGRWGRLVRSPATTTAWPLGRRPSRATSGSSRTPPAAAISCRSRPRSRRCSSSTRRPCRQPVKSRPSPRGSMP